ncbi:MAG: bifunctional glutamate N-acetyltransferase/amino-acid acetyltransferase ArgJ [Alphaproteobacteria bacterium]|nr:bifunctional glutamate N-acetyltransferase/amino-acid acetyltransferase ArgJ [Alphaproteobacteria bacterium]
MIKMNRIEGGVCAPQGFQATSVHCGIRQNQTKKDLSLIFSNTPANAAAVYTTNLVKGAPLTVTKNNLRNGKAQAIICNSGNANTCNANGIEIAESMCELVADALHIDKTDVIVGSTGIIGQPLNIEPIKNGIPTLVANLSNTGSQEAAAGIMTTDTKLKEVALEFDINGTTCKIGGIAKGSGMIHPNMATMLVFITSDVNIDSNLLQQALSDTVKDTFNMISVDGDTSTNDMCVIIANGLANNTKITEEDESYNVFVQALNELMVNLCRKIAKDGEGATRLIECTVSEAETKDIAKTVAKSVVCSSLLKAAIFGSDANWGRILCAIGYSGAKLDVNKIDVSFKSNKGSIEVCKNGSGVDFSEEKAKEILLEDEIEILVSLNSGTNSATAWGCDLTYDYVKINGDYRS